MATICRAGDWVRIEVGGQRLSDGEASVSFSRDAYEVPSPDGMFRRYEPGPMQCELEYRFNVGDVDHLPRIGEAIDIHMPNGAMFSGLVLTDVQYTRQGTHWEVTYRGRAGGCDALPVLESPRDRLRKIISSRCAPAFHCRRGGIAMHPDQREKLARETLRRVVGERKYREFLRSGFVSLRAASGLTYQVFPGSAFTKVYDRGRLVDRLCVVLDGRFPPTDSVIMRYLLLTNDEKLFRQKAVKQGAWAEAPSRAPALEARPLPEVYREMKAVAA